VNPPSIETVYLLIILRIGRMILYIVFLGKFVIFLGLRDLGKPFHLIEGYFFDFVCLMN
jgi:hypothetical protein